MGKEECTPAQGGGFSQPDHAVFGIKVRNSRCEEEESDGSQNHHGQRYLQDAEQRPGNGGAHGEQRHAFIFGLGYRYAVGMLFWGKANQVAFDGRYVDGSNLDFTGGYRVFHLR